MSTEKTATQATAKQSEATPVKVYRSVTEVRRAFYPKASSAKSGASAERARNGIARLSAVEGPTS